MDRLRYQENPKKGQPNQAPAVVFLRKALKTKGLKICFVHVDHHAPDNRSQCPSSDSLSLWKSTPTFRLIPFWKRLLGSAQMALSEVDTFPRFSDLLHGRLERV
jgi:hypothetical protein